MVRMKKEKIVIIGAGIGGLSAALLLSHKGYEVTVFDSHGYPGGKMRAVQSAAGLVDAGPTVLTLKHLFDELFQDVEEKMEDHLCISQEPILARHFWHDGSTLDLYSNIEKTCDEISNFAGNRAADEFRNFNSLTRNLFSTFDEPILRNPKPSIVASSIRTLKSLHKIGIALRPGQTLNKLTQQKFTDPRLQQLFSRYSTYVGGSPFDSPAILSLIWQAEALGVWRIAGGMHNLAKALKQLAEKRGATFVFDTTASRILVKDNQAIGVRLANDQVFYSKTVIFNGDPKALHDGMLGEQVTKVVPSHSVKNRSLSAYVWTFSAKTSNKKLIHHNVFFNREYSSEFDQISKNLMPLDPTLYVCAQNRGQIEAIETEEKFEIIMNAPPMNTETALNKKEYELCRETTFGKLEKMGLKFNLIPGPGALTTPRQFNQLFPASNGSLYGLNPKKFMTTFTRPLARTKVDGLYLVGGGVHPGPGVPMAMQSGRHAAEAIVKDLTSI